MGVKLQNAVLDANLPPTKKLILVAMARWAENDGSGAFLGVKKIHQLTGFSQRTVEINLKEMLESGLLILEKAGGGRGNKTEYRINLNPESKTPFLRNPELETPFETTLNPESDDSPSLKTNERLITEVGPELPEWFEILAKDERWPIMSATDRETLVKTVEEKFKHLDLVIEAMKATEWLLTPPGLKKKLLKAFWLNWIGRTKSTTSVNGVSATDPNRFEVARDEAVAKAKLKARG